MIKYIRLLSYENALALIEFINSNPFDDNYANITPGGVCIKVNAADWDSVMKFIDSLNTRFEVCDEHPMMVEKHIVETYKFKNIL